MTQIIRASKCYNLVTIISECNSIKIHDPQARGESKASRICIHIDVNQWKNVLSVYISCYSLWTETSGICGGVWKKNNCQFINAQNDEDTVARCYMLRRQIDES